MSTKKTSHRARKYRKAVSQHLSEMNLNQGTEKEFVDKKEHAGQVERSVSPQIGGGEKDKEKWWKAVTTTKTNSTKAVAASDTNPPN